jgi:hypothetical protein
MPGKAKPAPKGWVKPSHVEARTKGKWKASAIRKIIREGRWREVTGMGDKHHTQSKKEGKRPGPRFISEEAAERLEQQARRYSIPLKDLAGRMGVSEDTLRLIEKPDMQKTGGRIWHTSKSEAKRLLKQKRMKDESLSPQEAGRAWKRDRHTVLRWTKDGTIPEEALVSDGVFMRIRKDWARKHGKRLSPRSGRFVKGSAADRKKKAKKRLDEIDVELRQLEFRKHRLINHGDAGGNRRLEMLDENREKASRLTREEKRLRDELEGLEKN